MLIYIFKQKNHAGSDFYAALNYLKDRNDTDFIKNGLSGVQPW